MQPGSTLGPYTIVEQLGAGGMGVVYRARDTRLGRDVALKVLLPESNSDPVSRRRLLNEAKAASALNHPNTVTVYETSSVDGIDFIAMECIQGETLAARIARGEIPISEALSIALNVAEGLAAAHAVGLVHRDLKPSNIMITRDGRAKILDFGLAQRTEVAMATGDTQSHSLTMSGAVVGTLAYMSPEQARGDEPGPASDIFAYGAVLYEMLCRKRAFEGKTQLDVYHQICYETEVPLCKRRGEVPPALIGIIEKALAKKPGERFESMAVLAESLRPMLFSGGTATGLSVGPAKRLLVRWAVTALGICGLLGSSYWFWAMPKPFDSVAVLPFTNATGDSSVDYLVQGLSDGLRRDLTRLKGLTVASADSAQTFRGTDISPRVVARKLGVSGVIAGNVSAIGTQLRLNVQIDTAISGQPIWTQSYDVPRTDMARTADRLWVDAADSLGRKLGSSKTRHIPAAKAYDLYLRGQSALASRGGKDVQKAVSLFQQSIEADADFGMGYAGLAEGYLLIANVGEQPSITVLPQAREAARYAIDLDPTLAEARLAYAMTISLSDFDWAGAETAFRRSIFLDPSSARAHSWFAMIDLVPLKRFDEALMEAQRAVDEAPDSPVIKVSQATTLLLSRHYDESIRLLQRVSGMQDAVLHTKAMALIARGNPEDAIRLLTQASAQDSKSRRILGSAYAVAGRRPEAYKIATDAESDYQRGDYFSPCSIASIYAPLREADKAMRWLDECRAKADPNLRFIGVEVIWDPIRKDPRFQILLRNIGLN